MATSLAAEIRNCITFEVRTARVETRYRAPLVAFVSADHPEFAHLKVRVDPTHLLPSDLLPHARSVVSFFIPFDREVVAANAQHPHPARKWAIAYVETNALIGHVCRKLAELLRPYGYGAQWELPTYNFDPVKLVSRWSHKSIGVIAGLGSFGLHRMVITDAGCAGRFGSVVTDAPLEPTPATPKERCRYYVDGGCKTCVSRCPAGALQTDKFDRTLCYQRCLETDRFYSDLPLTDVCGKCATGPCALKAAV